ncbi:hypothetical protein Y695_00269 [Hydrogenophaga sp. T4]|nr:hypothetical protein Y695_00269 [Hydrogenophaga sp. T4]
MSVENQAEGAMLKQGARIRRINDLAKRIHANKYLEIGVSHGKTFHEILVPEKCAVDPRFKFDHRPLGTDKVMYFEGTSDAYFSAICVGKKFDIIYLDGLHTFEQTYRDLCNALLHSHEKSIILIDDTVPNDIFSSIPDQAECLRLRSRSGVSVKAWHGDVYKTIFAVNVFHPSLKYRTIMGSGNPQTLIWKTNDITVKRLKWSFEEISRLDYVSFLANFSEMHPGKEDIILDECLADLNI